MKLEKITEKEMKDIKKKITEAEKKYKQYSIEKHYEPLIKQWKKEEQYRDKLKEIYKEKQTKKYE